MVQSVEMKFVVIGDLHGSVDLFNRAVQRYEKNDEVIFVPLGDLVDGVDQSAVRRTLDVAQDLGERCIGLWGNHEWAMLGAMTEDRLKAEQLDDWQRFWVRQEKNTTRDYGVPRVRNINEMNDFAEAFQASGHLELLRGWRFALETDEFVALHAGFSRAASVGEQMVFLQSVQNEYLESGVIEEMPSQITEFGPANDVYANRHLGKKIISGHSHLSLDTHARSTDDAMRIRLSSNIANGDPLFVWESWSNEVKAITI